MPSFLAGLIAIAFLSACTAWRDPRSREQLSRAIVTIVLNWCAGMAYVQNSGNLTPWQFNIFIDSASAAVILWHPAWRAQAYIGLFYMLQIAFHAAYGIREALDQRVDQLFYYDAITWIAWGQLLAMGTWCSGIWGKDAVRRWRDHSHALDCRKSHSHHGAAS